MAEAATALEPRDRAWNDICELGLEGYVADLDAKGYCLIPPEIANPNNLAERMLAALLDIAEKRNGERPDVVTGATHANRPPLLQGFDGQKFAQEAKKEGKDAPPPILLKEPNVVDSPFGDRMNLILYDDEVFAEALMNPPLLALVTYLIGYSAVLSSMGCWMKGPCKSNFQLHSDSAVPEPMPPQAYQAQCTYLLTDFNRETGATCAVPGSHKWCRKPTEREAALLPYEEGGKDQAVLLGSPRRLVGHMAREHLARRVQSHRAGAASKRDGLPCATVHSADRGLHRQGASEADRQVRAATRDPAPAWLRSRVLDPGRPRVVHPARQKVRFLRTRIRSGAR